MGEDWIQERIECRASVIFARVCQSIESDIQAMEKYAPDLPVKEQVTCHVKHERDAMTVEGRPAWHDRGFTLVLRLDESKEEIEITVTPPSGTRSTHRLYADWHPREHRCVLFFDGDPMEPWQVSKKLLEPLLFTRST